MRVSQLAIIRPEAVELSDEGRVFAIFGVTPLVLRRWEKAGCPISYPEGRGRGKRAVAVTDDVLRWLRNRRSDVVNPNLTIAEKLRIAKAHRRARKGERAHG